MSFHLICFSINLLFYDQMNEIETTNEEAPGFFERIWKPIIRPPRLVYKESDFGILKNKRY